MDPPLPDPRLSKLEIIGNGMKYKNMLVGSDDYEYVKQFSSWGPDAKWGAHVTDDGEFYRKLLKTVIVESHVRSPYILKGDVMLNDTNPSHNYMSNFIFRIAHQDDPDNEKGTRVHWELVMRELIEGNKIDPILEEALIINLGAFLPEIDSTHRQQNRTSSTDSRYINGADSEMQILESNMPIRKKVRFSDITVNPTVIQSTTNNRDTNSKETNLAVQVTDNIRIIDQQEFYGSNPISESIETDIKNEIILESTDNNTKSEVISELTNNTELMSETNITAQSLADTSAIYSEGQLREGVYRAAEGYYYCKFKNVVAYKNQDPIVCGFCYDSINKYVYSGRVGIDSAQLDSALDIKCWKLSDKIMSEIDVYRNTYIGVTKEGPRWRAIVTMDIGTYPTAEGAARVVDLYSLAMGATSSPNFPSTDYDIATREEILRRLLSSTQSNL